MVGEVMKRMLGRELAELRGGEVWELGGEREGAGIREVRVSREGEAPEGK